MSSPCPLCHAPCNDEGTACTSCAWQKNATAVLADRRGAPAAAGRDWLKPFKTRGIARALAIYLAPLIGLAVVALGILARESPELGTGTRIVCVVSGLALIVAASWHLNRATKRAVGR